MEIIWVKTIIDTMTKNDFKITNQLFLLQLLTKCLKTNIKIDFYLYIKFNKLEFVYKL